jgi:sortase A
MHSSEVKLEALGGACTITSADTADAGIAISACELGGFVGTFDIVFTTESETFVVEYWVPNAAEFEDVEVAPIVELSDGVVATLRALTIDLDVEIGSELNEVAVRVRPGLHPDGARIGEAGIAYIFGNRTTYGQPFHRLDELTIGDEISVTTADGVFTFAVVSIDVVEHKTAYPTVTEAALLLAANHPKWTDDQEVRVLAVLLP